MEFFKFTFRRIQIGTFGKYASVSGQQLFCPNSIQSKKLRIRLKKGPEPQHLLTNVVLIDFVSSVHCTLQATCTYLAGYLVHTVPCRLPCTYLVGYPVHTLQATLYKPCRLPFTYLAGYPVHTLQATLCIPCRLPCAYLAGYPVRTELAKAQRWRYFPQQCHHINVLDFALQTHINAIS